MGRAARARQQLEKASDSDGPAETEADTAAAVVHGNGDEPWWKHFGMNSSSGRMPGAMPDTSVGSTSEATGKSDEGLSPGGSKPMHVNDFFKSAGDGLNAAGKSTGDFFKDLGENTVKIGENTVKTMADLPSNTVKTLEVLTTTSLSPSEPTTPTKGTAGATALIQRAGPPADTNGGGTRMPTRMPGTMPDHAYAITRTPSSPADFFPKPDSNTTPEKQTPSSPADFFPKPKPNTITEKPSEPPSPSVATEKLNEGLSPGGRPLQMQMDDFFKSAGDGLNAAGKSTGDFLKDLGENTVKTIAESGEAIGKVALAPVKLFDSKVLGRRSPKRARSFRKAAVEQAALEKATREAFLTREAERLQSQSDLVATARLTSRSRRSGAMSGAMLMAWQAQAGAHSRARGFAALLLGLMLLALGTVECDGSTLPVVTFELFTALRWPRMLVIYRL
jgi:hypothetical protein